MADSAAFGWTCDELERRTDLDRLEARGTIRISLQQAGLDASRVKPHEMRAVIERVLPKELVSRGIEGVEALCARLASGVVHVSPGDVGESPDEVFRRLGGA